MIDGRTFIRLHDGMPDHPKIDALSDRAFRLLIESWCWCSRHLTDGFIPAATWRKRGTPRARAELIAAGLAIQTDDGVMMHDYLEHQRSAADVEQVRQAQGEGGSFGNHVRWHVRKGITRPGCPHCHRPPRSVAEPISQPIGVGSVSDRRGRDRDRDMGPTVPISGGPVDRPPSDRYARTPAQGIDEETSDGRQLDTMAAAELRELTGRPISAEHAAQVRRRVLDGRQVRDPRAYLVKALRADPTAFLPPGRNPADRPLNEALARDGCPHGAAQPDQCALCRNQISEGDS